MHRNRLGSARADGARGRVGIGLATWGAAALLIASGQTAWGGTGPTAGKPSAPTGDKVVGPLSTDPGFQTQPAAAWDPIHQRYLVAWKDGGTSPLHPDVGGCWAGRDGAALGTPFLLAWELTGDCGAPSLACAPDEGSFLVAWAHESPGGNGIYARVVDGSGGVGALIPVYSAFGTAHSPVVACDPVSNLHLVCWQTNDAGGLPWGVFARPFTPAGLPAGGGVFVAPATSGWNGLALAADAAHGGWLLVSEVYESGSAFTDIQAVRLGPDGAPAAEPILIDGSAQSQVTPRVAHDWRRDEYLAVWVDLGSSPVLLRGRRLDHDGAPLGGAFTISQGLDLEGSPGVAWSDAANGYLATFAYYYGPNDTDVYAVLVPATGPVGEPAAVVSNLSTNEWTPALAFADGLDFLAVWQDERNFATTGWDVYGRALRLGCIAGYAWSGFWPERDRPLTNLPLRLHASVTPWTPGALLAETFPDAQGRFAIPVFHPQPAYVLVTPGLPYYLPIAIVSVCGDASGLWWIGYHSATAFASCDQNEFWFHQGTGVGDAPAAPPPLAVSPNPFNPRTTIRFSLARAGQATVNVHDQRGRRVRALTDGPFDAGLHALVWDGRDDASQAAPSGTYLVRVTTADGATSRKVTLAR